MKNHWNDSVANEWLNDDLAMRVYSSRLLGLEDTLVLHGGGNTSVKTRMTTLLGEEHEVLCVKGSGWDLASIEAAGFPAVKLDTLLKLAQLEQLSDADMVKEQRAAMLDPSAPNPSVEAILHALIPFKYVDHTHADAVITINNSPDGEQVLKRLLGDTILYIPYVMPGFILAKKIAELTRDIDWQRYHGMVLLNHGVFSFADDAKTSYTRMIDLVTKAELYLDEHARPVSTMASNEANTESSTKSNNAGPASLDLQALCKLRAKVSQLTGKPMLAQINQDPQALQFCNHPQLGSIACRGPLTPDHVIRTKRVPLIVDSANIEASLDQYASQYQDYFNRHSQSKDGSLTCLDPAPRWALWPGVASVCFGDSVTAAAIVSDISQHTMQAILTAEALGGWQALGAQDIFDLEYWELEQAKLSKSSSKPVFKGKIALITGAANGIGRACADYFISQGAAVIALDMAQSINDLFSSNQVLGLRCDVTDQTRLGDAIDQGIRHFGGLDIVVCNAGIFPPSASIVDMPRETWDNSLDINLTSQQRLLQHAIPYLRLGMEPNIVIVASKNVPAPGPGAAAYSVAKAGLTQLARIAALELAGDSIRVNVIHPDAVFDTAIWTDEVLTKRAAHYGLSVQEYKTKNLLKTEIHAADVARLVGAIAGPAFAKTTAAQIPIDGGNERVI